MRGLTSVQLGFFYAFLSAVLNGIQILISRYVFVEYEIDPWKYLFIFVGMNVPLSLLYMLYKLGDTKKYFTPTHLKGMFILALLGVAASILYIGALNFTTAVNASVISAGVVASTAIFSSLLLGERLTRSQKLWIGFMTAAMYFAIAGLSAISLNSGDIAVFAALALYGSGNAYSKQLMKSISSEILAAYRLLIGSALFLISGIVIFGSDLLTLEASWWPYIAGFMAWITIFLFFQATNEIGPTYSIVVNRLAPIVTIVGAVIILDEPFSLVQAIAFGGMLIAVYKITLVNQSLFKKKTT